MSEKSKKDMNQIEIVSVEDMVSKDHLLRRTEAVWNDHDSVAFDGLYTWKLMKTYDTPMVSKNYTTSARKQ